MAVFKKVPQGNFISFWELKVTGAHFPDLLDFKVLKCPSSYPSVIDLINMY